jgi:hypothetical protein
MPSERAPVSPESQRIECLPRSQYQRRADDDQRCRDGEIVETAVGECAE